MRIMMRATSSACCGGCVVTWGGGEQAGSGPAAVKGKLGDNIIGVGLLGALLGGCVSRDESRYESHYETRYKSCYERRCCWPVARCAAGGRCASETRSEMGGCWPVRPALLLLGEDGGGRGSLVRLG